MNDKEIEELKKRQEEQEKLNPFQMVGDLKTCFKCGRKFLVERELFGVCHTSNMDVVCWDCLSDKDKKKAGSMYGITCDKKMKHIPHMKILRDDLILETCGQSSHIGCYIRFSNNKVHHSKSRGDDADVIVDYDINGDIVGIEFYEGLHKYKKMVIEK